MTCSSCSHENHAGAKFCEECGAPLGHVCASCGSELGPTAKFCSECGTRVAESGAGDSPAEPGSSHAASNAAFPTPSPGTRKIVTIVFADLAGSTALQERLDPESTQRFMESYYDAMRAAVESQGGTVTQLLGDGVKTVFGIPRVAEDDAIRAVRAAVAMQESFRTLVAEQGGAVGEIGLRVAVNTGEVVANDRAEIIGDPVNVAARLQEQGGDGDVVVGDSTARLVEALVTLAPLGSFTLKGRREAVAAFTVESLERPASAATAAFVGRGDELARITKVYDTAAEKRATSLVVVLGSPGLGKSRLIDEFARRLGDTARFVEADCLEESASTFAPLALALRELLGIEVGASTEDLRGAVEAAISADDPDRARIAEGIASMLAGSPESPEETFFVVRRLFAALASDRPVVLVFDDLQWAEPMLLDLVEHLVEWGRGVPMLVLVGARPELREKRSSLATPGGAVADVLTLSGLDAGAAMRLAANVIGASDLPSAVAAKVLATSEGNPLFVGELVRMLVHEGALTREGDRWTTGKALAALEMPPTIHALLAARIERLSPEERFVLEHAAVIGRNFSRTAVAELLPHDVADLDARLESLRRGELIEGDTGWFFGEPVLRFHHVLIRDAAYRQLLKSTRAELHTRFADWAVARAGELVDSVEHDETIGWHLEQAHQHLRELGPLDAKGREIGERASTHLSAAGRRALAGDDVPLAASLLGRSIERLDPDNPGRADLALDWCEALLAAGDVGPAAGAIDALDRLVGQSDNSERLRAWHTCFAGQLTVLTAPEGLEGTADSVAAAAESLASQGDAAGEANAHYVYALALRRLGKIGACEAALDRALAAARRVEGDRRRANTVLAIAPLAALWGPSPVTRASGRCLDVVRVLRITQGAPAVEAVALSCQGVLEALRGRTEAARRMIASARTMVEELGITQRLLEVDVFGGQVDLLDGDPVAAERSLRAAFEGMRELGLGIDAARAAALLARALLAQDRIADAEALSHESEALAGDDLKAAIAWRGVRAEALARRGEHAAAVEFASKGVEIAATTDALLDHADARLALATALRAAGRDPEADAENRRASELWEEKGATLLAERTHSDAVPIAPDTALVERPASEEPVRRRHVRRNAATAMEERLEAAAAAGDFEAAREVFQDGFQEIDRPTGSTWGPDQAVASLQRLFRSENAHYRIVPLATLGDSLALGRRHSGASGTVTRRYDVGASENEVIAVMEADEHGRCVRSEAFVTDRLSDAIVCLYERYAELLPEGAEREGALMAMRSLAALLADRIDVDRIAMALAADLEAIDHRQLRTWSARDADGYLAHLRSLKTVADEIDIRATDVLALDSTTLLIRNAHWGTQRAGGGSYERVFISLVVLDANGRISRLEWFEDAHEAKALARFDELCAVPVARPPSVYFTNSAMRATERAVALWMDADWEGFLRLYSPDFRGSSHRRMLQFDLDLGEFVTYMRQLADMDSARLVSTAIASRGGRLALVRLQVEVSDGDVGPSEIEHLNVVETDVRGVVIAQIQFDPDALEAAYAELDDRFEAGEGAEHPRSWAAWRSMMRALGARDWDALTECHALGLVTRDHRLLGWGTLRGAAELTRWQQALVELAPDTQWRVDHMELVERGHLMSVVAFGTRDGGPFEMAALRVVEIDSTGKICRADLYDVDHQAEARARFAEVSVATHASQRFANAATRVSERFHRVWAEGDWERVAQLYGANFHSSDRRPTVQLELDRNDAIAFGRSIGEMGATATVESEIIATRGERLALSRGSVTVAGGDVGPSEIVSLSLIETDEHGDWTAHVRWDTDDLDAAYAELDARYEAGEGAASRALLRSIHQSIASRDWAPMVALCSPGFVEYDHQSLAVKGTTYGAEGWAEAFRTLAELAPDTIYRVHHVRTVAGGLLSGGVWQGTREGGHYEIPAVAVLEVDEQGQLARSDLYDDSDDGIEAALARLSELAEPVASSPPLANAATRVFQEAGPAWEGKDWERLAKMYAANFHLSDRRRTVQLELDRDDAIAFGRSLGEQAATSIQNEILATRGERLALTRSTVAVAGGDVGPSELVYLSLVETDEHGDWIAHVRWDDDELKAAYAELDARFDALGSGLGSALDSGTAHDPLAPIVKPTAASAAFDRWQVAFELGADTGDWDTMRRLCTPECVFDDRRRLALLRGDRDLMIESARTRVAQGAGVKSEVLGTAGDCVVTLRMLWSGGPPDGRFEIEYLGVCEVDEAGLFTAFVLIDIDERRAAQREAWARWGAIEPHVAAVMAPQLQIVDAFSAKDLDLWRAAFADDLIVEDHRHAGFGRLEGVDAYVESVVSLLEIAPETYAEIEWNWPAVDRHGYVCAVARMGTVPDGGGEFESHMLFLSLVSEGRITHVEMFERSELREALARLEALRPEASNAAPDATAISQAFSNAATRTVERAITAQTARDWEGFSALFAPEFRSFDRRGFAQLESGREEWLASYRQIIEMTVSRPALSVLATRGDRLALSLLKWQGAEGDIGPSEIDWLFVIQVDERGDHIAVVNFDEHDIDAAYVELDARFEAGEGGTRARLLTGYVRAYESRDWDFVAAMCTPGFAEYDHRPLALLPTSRGGEAWARADRALLDLSPDTRPRIEHVRHASGGLLQHITFQGTRDGSEWQIPFVAVVVLDTDDKFVRSDLYDPEQIDLALARFEKLSAPAPSPGVFDNSATRAHARAVAAIAARDFERFSTLYVPEFRHFDRRRLFHVDSDREGMLTAYRPIVEMTTSVTGPVLATRGERLAMVRMNWRGAEGDVGPSAIDYVLVVEANEHDDHLAVVTFDPDDLDAAYSELDERWAAGEVSLHPQASTWVASFQRGFANRDWAAMRALTSHDQVAVNHRLVGWGTLRGQGAWVPTLEALVELSPDAQLRSEHLRTCEHGHLVTLTWHGTRDGGEFETPQVLVVELDAQGKQIRVDLWDIEQLDVANERFESIAASAPHASGPALVKPNRASKSLDTWLAAFDAGATSGDWEAMRSLVRPDVIFEDRQARSQLSGDRELMLASLRERATAGARPALTPVANTGDRISVNRILWSGGPADGRFEIETLNLIEVDESGLWSTVILFDPEDTATVRREAWTRWAAIDPIAAPWVELLSGITDAWNNHDPEAIRANFGDDVVVEDYRHAGLGRLDGAEAHVEIHVVLWELAPDQRIEFRTWHAIDRHAALIGVWREGTLSEGGAFDSEFLWLGFVENGVVTQVELFETDALDTALARFEELRPDPLCIPPNAATRNSDRRCERGLAGDWEGLKALYAAEVHHESRRPLFDHVGDETSVKAELEYMFGEVGARVARTLLATNGDRLALENWLWTARDPEQSFELEVLVLVEVDAEGLVVAAIVFDCDDHAGAFAELWERDVANGTGALPSGGIDVMQGVNEHDLVRVRSGLRDDFILNDRRHAGMGRLEGPDAYIKSLVALHELTRDWRHEILYCPVIATDRRVTVARTVGSNSEGGAVESFYVTLMLFREEKLARMEFFELEQLDDALARLEELCSAYAEATETA